MIEELKKIERAEELMEPQLLVKRNRRNHNDQLKRNSRNHNDRGTRGTTTTEELMEPQLPMTEEFNKL